MSDGILLFIIGLLAFLGGALIGIAWTSYHYENRYSISKYSGNVVIDKSHSYLTIDSCGFKRTIVCTDYELSLYNLGDTIK